MQLSTVDVSPRARASSPNDCRLILSRCDVGEVVTINELPDDVLLTIFDFLVGRVLPFPIEVPEFGNQVTEIEPWQLLVHVCRRWRGLVFESPRRLELQLFCTTETPARKTRDVWPALPLLIRGDVSETLVDNVISLLELSNRIFQIELNWHTSSQIKKLWAAMQMPFPELQALYLSFRGVLVSHVPDLPNSFLDGSAPRLRSLALVTVPLHELPKLLSPAPHLTSLYLRRIPYSWYLSPEAIVTCLRMLTSLSALQLEFEYSRLIPVQDRKTLRSPLSTRSVLPALTVFSFKGAKEYLEDFVARIDTPRLYRLSATVFNHVDLNVPELIRFISRSSKLKAPNESHIVFGRRAASIRLQPQASDIEYFEIQNLCREPDWQVSSLVHFCRSSLPLLSTTENLFICNPLMDSQPNWEGGIENIEWLELLLPFTAVKNLYLSRQFVLRVASALQETTGGETMVLPALQNLYLEGFQPSKPVQEDIERFILARQVTEHPVAIFAWDRNRPDVPNDSDSEEVDD